LLASSCADEAVLDISDKAGQGTFAADEKEWCEDDQGTYQRMSRHTMLNGKYSSQQQISVRKNRKRQNQWKIDSCLEKNTRRLARNVPKSQMPNRERFLSLRFPLEYQIKRYKDMQIPSARREALE
jgi:hypothetical protein